MNDATPQAVCPNCGVQFDAPIVVPRDVKDWMARTTPLHLMVGDVPPGWSGLTLTNATGRGAVRSLTRQVTHGDGGQTIYITLHIPPRTTPALPEPRRALPSGG